MAPEPPATYRTLPAVRPKGLRSRWVGAGAELWRVEASPPGEWTWEGLPRPRHRFDPASGTFRARHASTDVLGALQDQYHATGRVVPADHAHHHLARLTVTRRLRVLDLRTERNLDALDVDHRMGTGQSGAIWDTCQHLADAARRWWPDLDAIVYRCSVMPSPTASYALFGVDGFAHESWPLAETVELLAQSVLHEGFTVGWDLETTDATNPLDPDAFADA